jgi:deoxyribonuclease IV
VAATLKLLLGAHMSIAGGVHRAVERGVALGCTALQLFTRNQVQWHTRAISGAEADRFRAAHAASGIGPVVAHANYLINVAGPDERTRERSLDGLRTELRHAALLALPWVVLHPGNHMGQGEAAGLRQAAELARRALDEPGAPSVGLLLETTAGQGTALGHSFEQLAELLVRIGVPERLGVCLDTCHVFAAGYDLRTEGGYERVIEEFDRVIGLDRLHALHVNDSKRECGSRVDRHAHIGRGHLGLTPFRCLLRDRRFARVPKLLETPKSDAERDDWDAVNLATLRSLVETDREEAQAGRGDSRKEAQEAHRGPEWE